MIYRKFKILLNAIKFYFLKTINFFYETFFKSEFDFKIFLKNSINREKNSIIEILIKFLHYQSLLKIFSNFFFSSVDKNIVCFGAHNGVAFLDNPKYLFLYLNSNSNYKCYWFTSSREVFNGLKKKGYSVVYNFSLKAIKILKKAGYIISSSKLDLDFLPISFSKETIIVFTWHGHQFKKIIADFSGHSPEEVKYYDYLISPSKNINKYLISAFQIDPKKIIITGLPRNDILFQSDEKLINKIKNKYEISKKYKKIILFAPTWRQKKFVKIPLKKEEINEIIKFLEDKNFLLIYKPHIIDNTVLFENSKNVIVIDKSEEPQELIIISDMLITDYSTIYFDFILIQKPAILFPYDFEEYVKYRGIYHNLEDIAVGPIVKTGKELINALKTLLDWLPTCERRILEVRDKYWDYHNGKSCERFFKKINLKLK